MSVHVTSWVLRHSPAKLSDRLVLLALADYANDDGGGAYPAQATLAFEAVTTDRNVRRSLKRMEDKKWIVREGTSPAGTVIYRVVMDPDNWSDPSEFRTRTSETEPRTSETETGAQMSDDPSVNPPEEPSEKEVLETIFNYWVEKSGKDPKRTKFTDGRKTKIKARLKNYTPREICEAINGVLGSSFHVENGHTELEMICSSDSKLEKYRDMFAPSPTDERYTYDAIARARQIMTGEQRAAAEDAGKYPFDARAERIVEGGR